MLGMVHPVVSTASGTMGKPGRRRGCGGGSGGEGGDSKADTFTPVEEEKVERKSPSRAQARQPTPDLDLEAP